MSLTDPLLAGSPDGPVHDPSDADHTPGLVEIRNLFSAREKTLNEASTSSTLFGKE